MFSIARGKISSRLLLCQKILLLSNNTQYEEKTGKREITVGKGEWVDLLEK